MTKANRGDIEAVKKISGDFYKRDKKGRIALTYAAKEGNLEMVEHLFDENYSDEKTADIFGMTPLMYSSLGHVEVVKFLLSKKVDLNITAEIGGGTALSLAHKDVSYEMITACAADDLAWEAAQSKSLTLASKDRLNEKAVTFLAQKLPASEMRDQVISSYNSCNPNSSFNQPQAISKSSPNSSTKVMNFQRPLEMSEINLDDSGITI